MFRVLIQNPQTRRWRAETRATFRTEAAANEAIMSRAAAEDSDGYIANERRVVPVARSVAPVAFFRCIDCGHAKPMSGHGCGTGYGIRPDNFLSCYECCGGKDAEAMERDGRATLYLVTDRTDSDGRKRYAVTNWPGTLRIPLHGQPRQSWHNMAGRNGRRDVWFAWRGRNWHGVNIGDSDILRVNAIKGA
jgi:hypothetical protein